MSRVIKLFAAIITISFATSGFADEIEEIVVQGDLGSLPSKDVKSIFGFDKSILETPRSASSVSEEMMDRFNMYDIDELVALAPGSFCAMQSPKLDITGKYVKTPPIHFLVGVQS